MQYNSDLTLKNKENATQFKGLIQNLDVAGAVKLLEQNPTMYNEMLAQHNIYGEIKYAGIKCNNLFNCDNIKTQGNVEKRGYGLILRKAGSVYSTPDYPINLKKNRTYAFSYRVVDKNLTKTTEINIKLNSKTMGVINYPKLPFQNTYITKVPVIYTPPSDITSIAFQINAGEAEGAYIQIDDIMIIEGENYQEFEVYPMMYRDGLVNNINMLENLTRNNGEENLINDLKYLNKWLKDFNVKGTWDVNTKYPRFSFVYHMNKTWFAYNDPPLGLEPSSSGVSANYWTGYNTKGLKGYGGININFRGNWRQDVSYNVFDVVVFKNKLWASVAVNKATPPNYYHHPWVLISIPQMPQKTPIQKTKPQGQAKGSFWFKILQGDEIVKSFWKNGSNSPVARFAPGCFSINDKFYVAGGHDQAYQGLAQTHMYDVVTKTWSVKANLPQVRWSPFSFSIDGKGYLVGGDVSGVRSATTVMYDPNTNAWVSKANLPEPLAHGVGASYGDKGFVFGGLTPNNLTTNKTYIYNSKTNAWSTGSNMSESRCAMAQTTYTGTNGNGKILVFGGAAGSAVGENTTLTEEYDVITNTWAKKANMTHPRSFCLGLREPLKDINPKHTPAQPGVSTGITAKIEGDAVHFTVASPNDNFTTIFLNYDGRVCEEILGALPNGAKYTVGFWAKGKLTKGVVPNIYTVDNGDYIPCVNKKMGISENEYQFYYAVFTKKENGILNIHLGFSEMQGDIYIKDVFIAPGDYSIDSKSLILGGIDDLGYTSNIVDRYNIKTNSWTVAEPLTYSTASMSAGNIHAQSKDYGIVSGGADLVSYQVSPKTIYTEFS